MTSKRKLRDLLTIEQARNERQRRTIADLAASNSQRHVHTDDCVSTDQYDRAIWQLSHRLDKVLAIHEKASDGHCVECDREGWPCATVRAAGITR